MEIKRVILETLSKQNELSFYALAKAAKTGFRSIKNNCEELQATGDINITKIGARPFYFVSITKKGKTTLKHLKK